MDLAARVLVGSLSTLLKGSYDEAKQRERDFITKLETAETNVDIFKYLLLIDTQALEAYVLQTKLQAEQSFRLSKAIAVVGFVIIAVGVSLGIGTTIIGENRLDAAYLASLAGILTEFISGVFFYLYNRTLQQMNIFHDKLLASKKIALDYLAESLKVQVKIVNVGKRKSTKGGDSLSKQLKEVIAKRKNQGTLS